MSSQRPFTVLDPCKGQPDVLMAVSIASFCRNTSGFQADRVLDLVHNTNLNHGIETIFITTRTSGSTSAKSKSDQLFSNSCVLSRR